MAQRRKYDPRVQKTIIIVVTKRVTLLLFSCFIRSGGSTPGLPGADAIIELIQRKDLRDALAERGREYAARNCWDLRKREYFDLVDSLLAR